MQFLDAWAGTSLAVALRPAFRPYFYRLLDAENAEYFTTRKFKRDDILAELAVVESADGREKLASGIRAALAPLERFLAQAGGPFLLGAEISHADAAVFGWALTSFTVPEIREGELGRKTWFSDELPHVKKWSETMLKWTEFEPKFPSPKR